MAGNMHHALTFTTSTGRVVLWAFVVLVFLAIVYLGVGRFAGLTQRHAIRLSVVRQAFSEGRLTYEEARDILGYDISAESLRLDTPINEDNGDRD
jgi:hypothetical protein